VPLTGGKVRTIDEVPPFDTVTLPEPEIFRAFGGNESSFHLNSVHLSGTPTVGWKSI